jgi:hypothetical protein
LAGGEKYIKNGILFKFALDSSLKYEAVSSSPSRAVDLLWPCCLNLTHVPQSARLEGRMDEQMDVRLGRTLSQERYAYQLNFVVFVLQELT